MGTRINIFTDPNREPHPWILRRAAEEAAKAFEGITINGSPGDINYYVNYALWRPVGGVSIGHFTHLEPQGRYHDLWLQIIPKCQFYTVTCDKTRDLLLDGGALDASIWKIRYGCDDRVRPERAIRFGVCGSVKPNGRKGEHLVRKMIEDGFDVSAWGSGWPCETIREWNRLPEFYASIDYLVVTSTNEGGPVPVIDALAAGVPVIAPDVGWCWEFPVIRYTCGDWNSLHTVLHSLCHPPTWKSWTMQHELLFMEAQKCCQ